LHHLYDFEGLVLEAARVLKAGGIYYCDHDMDSGFGRRFGLALSCYRKLRNPRAKYAKMNEAITPQVYELAEWQEKGIDSAQVIALFREEGFSVQSRYHWYGLSRVTDALFGQKQYSRGWAPLFLMVAVKK